MRIGIFTNNFKPIIGGLTTSIINFRKGLEDLGHEVHVFAPSFKDHQDEEENVFRYPSSPITYKAEYPVALPSAKDKKYFKSAGIELVHTQHPWVVGRYGTKLARRFGVPVVFTNHTMYPLYIDYIPKILPRRFTMALIEKSAIKYANRADAVIAPTDSIKSYLLTKGIKKPIHVVPSGIDQVALRNAPPANLKERYRIPKDHKIILNLGRVGPEKNLPTILEAYKVILDKHPKSTLVMAGGGFYLTKLKQIAKKLGLESKVVFTDWVEMDKRGGYFKEADIFIHSSLSETQGLILVESMTVGVPIVAIKANGVVDVVADGKGGILTKETPEALAKGVSKVLEDPSLKDRLAKGALEKAKEYTVQNTSKKLEEVYKSVLNPS